MAEGCGVVVAGQRGSRGHDTESGCARITAIRRRGGGPGPETIRDDPAPGQSPRGDHTVERCDDAREGRVGVVGRIDHEGDELVVVTIDGSQVPVDGVEVRRHRRENGGEPGEDAARLSAAGILEVRDVVGADVDRDEPGLRMVRQERVREGHLRAHISGVQREQGTEEPAAAVGCDEVDEVAARFARARGVGEGVADRLGDEVRVADVVIGVGRRHERVVSEGERIADGEILDRPGGCQGRGGERETGDQHAHADHG